MIETARLVLFDNWGMYLWIVVPATILWNLVVSVADLVTHSPRRSGNQAHMWSHAPLVAFALLSFAHWLVRGGLDHESTKFLIADLMRWGTTTLLLVVVPQVVSIRLVPRPTARRLLVSVGLALAILALWSMLAVLLAGPYSFAY